MCTVIRISKEGKVRPVRRRALRAMPAIEDRASLVALIYALIPLELQTVGDDLEAEVTDLAGERDSRAVGHPGYVRWRQQRGVDLIFESAPGVLPLAGPVQEHGSRVPRRRGQGSRADALPAKQRHCRRDDGRNRRRGAPLPADGLRSAR